MQANIDAEGEGELCMPEPPAFLWARVSGLWTAELVGVSVPGSAWLAGAPSVRCADRASETASVTENNGWCGVVILGTRGLDERMC